MSGVFQPIRESPGGGVLGIGGFAASNMLVLTDGTIICQSERFREWRRLTPDEHGSYANGHWTDIASMVNAREFYASAVFPDGRVAVLGGELRSLDLGTPGGPPVDAAEIWDPATDSWSNLDIPAAIRPASDAPACLLADGRWLVGAATNNNTCLFDPETNTWSDPITKPFRPNEETWTLLPDGSVLAVNTFNPRGVDRFLPDVNQWISENQTPHDLTDEISHEIGPQILMADGRVFAVGGSGRTAIYTPSGNHSSGTWADGPDILTPDDRLFRGLDAPGALLPNGHVLFVAGNAWNDAHDSAGDPTYFEFDGEAITSLGIPFNAAQNWTWRHRIVVLPTGQALITWANPQVWTFTPATSFAGWQPEILAAPAVVDAGQRHPIYGTQLCGVSQASSYGDDYQAAQNFPLVRYHPLDGTGRILYGSTGNPTSLGVARDGTIMRVSVTPPADVRDGHYLFEVVAHGVSSRQRVVQVGGQPDWLWCRLCHELTFTGNGPVGVCAGNRGGAHDHVGSGMYRLVGFPAGVAESPANEPFRARWCQVCQALTVGSLPGVCPGNADRGHDLTGSGVYALLDSGLANGVGQGGWVACVRCAAVNLTEGEATGPCPAGGDHLPAENSYSMLSDTPIDQENWRHCSGCEGMYFAGNPSAGICPASAAGHRPGGSGSYAVFSSPTGAAANVESGWVWCHQCAGLWRDTAAGALNVCPAGGTHSRDGSGDYTVMIFQPGRSIGQRSWHSCANCSVLWFAGNGSNGKCAGPTREHQQAGSEEYHLYGAGSR